MHNEALSKGGGQRERRKRERRKRKEGKEEGRTMKPHKALENLLKDKKC
jgi:hypothetical protein